MTGTIQLVQNGSSRDDQNESALQLNTEGITTIGLGALSSEDQAGLIRAFNYEFKIRVGQSILDRLMPSESDEIEKLIDAEDVHGADEWFESHGIDRRYIAQLHYDALVHELAVNAEQILESIGITNEEQKDQ